MTYTTTQGDMWDMIAYKQLGSVSYTDQLIRANQHYVGYYVFPAGIVLTLPETTKAVNDALPPWKQAVG